MKELPDCDKDSLFISTGQYCVYKESRGCPTGLTQGAVFWDDDDSYNANSKGGFLPVGRYDKNTWIYFCCKTDGNKDNPVLLPSRSPFYLLTYKSAKCQMVKWAVASLEWIYYDTEHFNNKDKVTDAYPYNAGKMHPTVYYCYYRGKIKNVLQSLTLVMCVSIVYQINRGTRASYKYISSEY